MNTEVNNRAHSGWNNWRKRSGIICDKRIRERKDSQDDRSASYDVRDGDNTND